MKQFNFYLIILCISILVSCKSGTSVEKPQSTAQPSIATATPTDEVEEKMSAEEIAGYEDTANHYWPELSDPKLDEILNEMGTAQSLLNRDIEYDQEWDNSKRENIAFAVAIYLENQRGVEPLHFESDGKTYFYNPDIEDLMGRWEVRPESDETRKNATIQFVVPEYRDQDNIINVYWNRNWIKAHGSDNIDYSHYVNKGKMDDGTIDVNSTMPRVKRLLQEHDATYIPMIAMDTKISDLELFPLNKGGNLRLYNRIDFVIPDPNDLYSLNVKLVSVGPTQVYYPESSELCLTYKSFLYEMSEYFEWAFEKGYTYYIGINPDHDEGMASQPIASEVLNGYDSSNSLLSESVWGNMSNTSFMSVLPFSIYDGNSTIRDNEIVPYP